MVGSAAARPRCTGTRGKEPYARSELDGELIYACRGCRLVMGAALTAEPAATPKG